jgi:hypothetical protein
MELFPMHLNRAATAEDLAALRRAVLAQLIAIDAAIEDIPENRYITFEVTRTNDRKGYRDPRPFKNNSPYQDDPRVRVTIEIELNDDQIGKPIIDTIADFESRS